jgi:hypothetical protein
MRPFRTNYGRTNVSTRIFTAIAVAGPFTFIDRKADNTADASVARKNAQNDLAVVTALASDRVLPCEVYAFRPNTWPGRLSNNVKDLFYFGARHLSAD